MAPISVANAVGAAAAAARLRPLDAARHQEALAIAAALAGWCPAETMAGPASSLKPFLFGGWPASVGLLAAQYAAAGLTGPPFILESPVGWLAHRRRKPRTSPRSPIRPGRSPGRGASCTPAAATPMRRSTRC